MLGKGAPKELYGFLQAGFIPVCGARFTRLAGLIDAPGCTVELALDEGFLLGGGKEQPLTGLNRRPVTPAKSCSFMCTRVLKNSKTQYTKYIRA